MTSREIQDSSSAELSFPLEIGEFIAWRQFLLQQCDETDDKEAEETIT